jgi:hypothetical protein
MIRKKNSFLTFIFSTIPGAGQMYMGFMKRGLCLMASFVLVITLGAWLNLSPILLLLPLIWFYAFFDTHNLRAMPDEEFYTMTDDYLFLSDLPKEKLQLLQSKYRNIFAIALILLGFTILWNNMIKTFYLILPEFLVDNLYTFGYRFPQIAIGITIILFGFYLIRGKKVELNKEDRQPKELEDLAITSIPNDKEEEIE